MARAGRTSGQGDPAEQAIIGRSTRVRGRISGEGDLVVEGSVEGDITVKGDLTIGEHAKTTSNVDAESVIVRGELEGDVRARGVVHLESGAKVRGDLAGASIAIDEGAEFSGRLDAQFELPSELESQDSRSDKRRAR